MSRENLTHSLAHECPHCWYAREKKVYLNSNGDFHRPVAHNQPTKQTPQLPRLHSFTSPFPLVRMGLAAPRKYSPVSNLSIRLIIANQRTAKLKFPPTPETPTGPAIPLISAIGYLHPTAGLLVLPLAILPPLTMPVDTSLRRRTRV